MNFEFFSNFVYLCNSVAVFVWEIPFAIHLVFHLDSKPSEVHRRIAHGLRSQLTPTHRGPPSSRRWPLIATWSTFDISATESLQPTHCNLIADLIYHSSDRFGCSTTHNPVVQPATQHQLWSFSLHSRPPSSLCKLGLFFSNSSPSASRFAVCKKLKLKNPLIHPADRRLSVSLRTFDHFQRGSILSRKFLIWSQLWSQLWNQIPHPQITHFNLRAVHFELKASALPRSSFSAGFFSKYKQMMQHTESNLLQSNSPVLCSGYSNWSSGCSFLPRVACQSSFRQTHRSFSRNFENSNKEFKLSREKKKDC